MKKAVRKRMVELLRENRELKHKFRVEVDKNRRLEREKNEMEGKYINLKATFHKRIEEEATRLRVVAETRQSQYRDKRR